MRQELVVVDTGFLTGDFAIGLILGVLFGIAIGLLFSSVLERDAQDVEKR